MAPQEGLDESKHSLIDHLDELRQRLLKAVIAVVITMVGCLAFAEPILQYSIEPLRAVLRDNNRVETLIVASPGDARAKFRDRLEAMSNVRFSAALDNLNRVSEIVEDKSTSKTPVDLIFVSTKAIGNDGALVSDVLEGIEPTPSVVYLVDDRQDPVIMELQLEGASVVLQPMRGATMKRVIRRAAAAAGKSASGDKLVVLSPMEPFFAYLKIALVLGLFLACPIWLYQAWQFVAPGLYKKERRAVLPIIFAGSVLFCSGGLFAYYVMFPMMFDVLVNQMMPSSLSGSFTVSNYLGLLMRVTVAFGVVFELPLALGMLASVGIVTADGLKRFRKYAVIISFIASAILTPADPLSQVMMALPLVVFYEVGIILAMFFGKKRTEASMALEPVD